MKRWAWIIGVLLVSLGVPFLIPVERNPAATDQHLPWQIEVDAQGRSRVFGLAPGVSTLAEARQALGKDFELAIIAAPEELGALEAYQAQVPLGFVLARVILTLEVEPAALEAIRSRAVKAEYMESTTRKITLHAEDVQRAEQFRIGSIAVIPNASLDEATLIARFGQPAERIPVSETLTHLLYPALGLDVVVDAKGKEVLQYVAPGDFARLRAPLVASAANGASAEGR